MRLEDPVVAQLSNVWILDVDCLVCMSDGGSVHQNGHCQGVG